MDWLFENIGKLLPIIIAILYLIGSARKGSEPEEEDPDAAERARKIQEEIRRKILERQKGAQPRKEQPEAKSEPAVSSPREREPHLREKPSRGDHWHAEQPKPVRREPEPARRIEEEPIYPFHEWESPSDPNEQFERQRREIEEKMRKAREIRQKADIPTKGTLVSPSSARRSADAGGRLAARLRKDLRARDSLRKAIVLKEVLDKPLGLR